MRSLGLGMTLIVLLAGTALVDQEAGVGPWLTFRTDLERAEERVDRLVTQNASLRREIELLETDPTAIDRVIREELGQALPGEQVVRFRRAERAAPAEAGEGGA